MARSGPAQARSESVVIGSWPPDNGHARIPRGAGAAVLVTRTHAMMRAWQHSRRQRKL